MTISGYVNKVNFGVTYGRNSADIIYEIQSNGFISLITAVHD